MIHYRSFLNTDPPQLADVWRSHPPLRGLVQAVTPTLLERYIFSKPYFDQHGLIVATDAGKCVGFAHAGFGPSEDLSRLGCHHGAICALHVVPHPERDQISRQLLSQAEDYLVQRGAKRIVAGGQFPVIPFYFGFYGGSRMPGVLRDDVGAIQLFQSAGYQERGRQAILHCRLSGFRPTVNRQQMANRRGHQVLASFDPLPESWWEACTLGWADRVRFSLQEKTCRQPCGQVMFWDMEPLASQWGVRGMGLYDLSIDADKRRCGRATYLVGEALRQLASQSVSLVEVQVSHADTGSLLLFEKLGFQVIDEGLLLEKLVV